MRATAMLLILACTAEADAPPGDADEELSKLQGEWTTVSVEANGMVRSTASSTWKLAVAGRKMSVRFGAVSFDANFTLGTAGQHRTLEMTETKWGQTPVKMEIRGIYKLAGGQLTICYHLGSKTPPPEFHTARGEDTIIQVLRQTK